MTKGGTMKKALCIIAILALTGCMTQRQLEAEKAFYEHLTAVAAVQQSTPIFKMTPAKEGEPIVISNVKAFEVFNPPPPLGDFAKQYQHRDFTPAWVPPLLGTIGNVGLVYGVGYSIKKALDSGNGSTYYQNVSGTGNTATIRQAGHTSLSGGITGNSNQVGGMIDNTSTPTVVEQPPPVVLEPFVIEQPEPIIIK